MVVRNITFKNPELIKAITRPEIYEPSVTRLIGNIAKRVERGGKGLGARNNIVTSSSGHLGAEVRSTRHNPRRSGSAWRSKNVGIAVGVARRGFESEVKKEIEAAWRALG